MPKVIELRKWVSIELTIQKKILQYVYFTMVIRPITLYREPRGQQLGRIPYSGSLMMTDQVELLLHPAFSVNNILYFMGRHIHLGY